MKYQKELLAIIELSKKASIEIMKIYETNFSIINKENKTPLTQADLISNKILVEGLKEKDFGYGFISEEMGTDLNDSEFVWVIDPVDGTKDFIQKTGEFSIMVALLKNSKPVFGFIHAPAINLTSFASLGEGAYIIRDIHKIPEGDNLIKLEVSNKSLDEFKIICSRHFFQPQDKKIAEKLNLNDLLPIGSVGIKATKLAKGQAEIFFYSDHQFPIWDIAPSHIIVKEAGGDVFDNTGKEPVYDLKIGKEINKGFFATNGQNKEEMMKVLRDVIE